MVSLFDQPHHHYHHKKQTNKNKKKKKQSNKQFPVIDFPLSINYESLQLQYGDMVNFFFPRFADSCVTFIVSA